MQKYKTAAVEVLEDRPFRSNENSWTHANSLLVVMSALFLIPVSVCTVAGKPFMVAATVSYFLLVLGMLSRNINRTGHLRFMLIGVAIDLATLLTIEFQRHAIDTVMNLPLSPLQSAHVFCSSVAVVSYVPLITLGFMNHYGSTTTNKIKWHKRLGITAFTFRTAGYFLMFSFFS